MATFGSNSFTEMPVNGAFLPVPDEVEEETTIHIPGGNTNVVFLGGKSAVEFTIRAKCTSSQLTALKNARGTTATLTADFGSKSGVALIAVRSSRVALNSVWFADLVFKVQ